MPVFDKVSQNIANFSTNQSLKKSLEEKNREKTKIYGYIGMEVYDLYKTRKLSIPELEVHFAKMETLEKETAEIEEKLGQTAGSGKTACGSCGYVLIGQMKFCPNCGKSTDPEMVTCACGKQIKNDMSFCPYCGNRLKEDPAGAARDKFRECICGARVPEGQFLCMECGRKVEG